MSKVIRIGIDTSKSVFVLHGVDEGELPVVRKKLRRRDVVEFLAKLEPTRIGIEACGGAHHWARQFSQLGQAYSSCPRARVYDLVPVCELPANNIFFILAHSCRSKRVPPITDHDAT